MFLEKAALSGDAMSRRGPLVEIHETSPYQTGPYALFGFIGVPLQYCENNEQQLKQAIIEQPLRLSGQAASLAMEMTSQD